MKKKNIFLILLGAVLLFAVLLLRIRDSKAERPEPTPTPVAEPAAEPAAAVKAASPNETEILSMNSPSPAGEAQAGSAPTAVPGSRASDAPQAESETEAFETEILK